MGLVLLTLISGFTYLWRLASGARSEYYAAVAVSMSKNFSNFFYGALDPAGTVSLDKVPGSYWLPALFTKVFGFSTWAVEAPNAIAAIAAVIFVAVAARRAFGFQAGLFAGAIIAATPVIAAVARSNQPQMFFVLALAIIADRAMVALKTGTQRSLIWAGVWIGIAFQTYMLEAWAVWPALIVAWLSLSTTPWPIRIKSLIRAGLASLFVSLSWIFCVWLTPVGARPYVGGTNHNNPWEMVFGYNGLGRFTLTQNQSSAGAAATYRSFTPPFSGSAGFFRLFNSQVGGQISWLLPAAFISIFVLIVASFKADSLKPLKGVILFFSLWFLIFFAMFSTVAGMHQFYTSSLAISMAVLIAGAFAFLTSQKNLASQFLLATIICATALWSWKLSGTYPHFFTWSYGVASALALLAIISIFARSSLKLHIVLPVGVGLAALSLIFTPAVWAINNVHHSNSINPVAGPNTDSGSGLRGGFGLPKIGGQRPLGTPPGNNPPPINGFNPPNFHDPLTRQTLGGPAVGPSQSADKNLVKYLEHNRLGSKYLLATFGGMSAAPYITATGENILPIGGFDGADPTPTLAVFKALVQSGDVKFVLTGSANGQGSSAATTEIESWVTTNCTIDSAAPDTSNLYRCTPQVGNN